MVRITGASSNCPDWPFRFKGSIRKAETTMQEEREIFLTT